MQTWYKRVKNDLTLIPDFIDYYEAEYLKAKDDVRLLGVGNLISAASATPHIFEHNFSCLQDVEAVLEYLNIMYRKERSVVFQRWFENQKAARALTARDAERYVDSDEMVNELAELINDVAYVRNLYLGILKGIDSKSYALNNIRALRVAGLDDAKV